MVKQRYSPAPMAPECTLVVEHESRNDANWNSWMEKYSRERSERFLEILKAGNADLPLLNRT